MSHEFTMVNIPCEYCGHEFPVRHPRPGRPKRYCTDRCRSRAKSEKRRQQDRAVDTLAQQAAGDPQHPLHPCRWCGLHCPGKDYCTLECEVLHQRMLQLQTKLRGLRPGMPLPDIGDQFAKLDRMRATRRRLRQENRKRYRADARASLDGQQRKAPNSEVQRLSRELACARREIAELRARVEQNGALS